MIQLVIIADDFTGALDTGVQFVNRGAATCVLTGASCDFSRVDEAVQVLVVNAESRHLSVSEAYNVVFRIAKTAEAAGIPYIYKKTDSALRGNIGCELNAVMDASGEACLIFAPAFPQMGRVTRRGIHYIDGVPVADSVFGKDPFEPVTESSVREIVRKQSDREIVSHSSGQVSLPFTAGIHIFDAEQKEDLDVIAKNLLAHRIRLSAGCAAFAAALADQLNLKGAGVPRIALPDSLIVVCGSKNPVTLRQLDVAEMAGYPRIRLTPEQKLAFGEPYGYSSQKYDQLSSDLLRLARENRLCILDVNDLESGHTDSYAEKAGLNGEEVRSHIAANLGRIGHNLLDHNLPGSLMCIGGDTLMALMNSAEIHEITPIGELAPGVVLTQLGYKGKRYSVISKSGGFGAPDLLCNLVTREGRPKIC